MTAECCIFCARPACTERSLRRERNEGGGVRYAPSPTVIPPPTNRAVSSHTSRRLRKGRGPSLFFSYESLWVGPSACSFGITRRAQPLRHPSLRSPAATLIRCSEPPSMQRGRAPSRWLNPAPSHERSWRWSGCVLRRRLHAVHLLRSAVSGVFAASNRRAT